MKIGIIAAMESEYNILREKLENETLIKMAGLTIHAGILADKEVFMCQCGIGKVNAAMAATILISEFECKLLINTGIAGGIGLKTKDVVIASKLIYHDVDVRVFGYEYGQIPGMPKEFIPNINSIVLIKSILNKLAIPYVYCPVCSGDVFVHSLEQIKNMDSISPIACEMEGAAIAQVATRAGVDFIVLRYISDCVGEESQIKDYFAFETEMGERSSEICLKILNNLYS